MLLLKSGIGVVNGGAPGGIADDEGGMEGDLCFVRCLLELLLWLLFLLTLLILLLLAS